ncbi:FtsW/RodA/SpoVE family cell cycle protein [Pseudalkalibacillus caeni]|uniref:FtsW/RodA/SpoVE family cell cycle protein n=1 Tax=Exobacillus caeni TaxID=2574798 RepID=A0A5R9F4A2_9BACL|nr:FtsW/RodA/SpoVE family cell cycle protein [Pseudalkalibacillus caeni]TLS37176.1 FtsW/RodA/SpoVE family cell cycle protein [Pseudalkalibacillus caeni]
MSDKKCSFVDEVISQIKSREAKKFVSSELVYHLNEAKKDYVKQGYSEEDAEEKAVKQMGNPISLGQQFNKLHRPGVDWYLVALLVTVMGLGFLPIFVLYLGDSPLGYMDIRHVSFIKSFSVLAGMAVVVGLMFVDYRKLKNLGWLFYAAGICLIFIFQSTGIPVNGVPYLMLGPFTASNMIVIPFFFLAWATFFRNERLKIWMLAPLFAVSLFLLLRLSNLPVVGIYLIMVMAMLWGSHFTRKKAAIFTGTVFSIFTIFALVVWNTTRIEQKDRILGFLYPENYPKGAGFIYLRIKESMSGAGWFGKSEAISYIPNTLTDLVFVGLTERLGWLFAIALVFVLSLLIVRMVFMMVKVRDPFGRILIIGGISLYTVQLAVNVGMTIGLFPIIGVSMPFISYGTMPVLFNSIIFGIILSVYRRKDLVSAKSV